VYSLPEGAYRYTAATQISGKTEKVSGQFAVTGRQVEMQNLTADFDLLRRLAAQTNGKFFPLAAWNKLEAEAETMKARMVVHTEERYTAALNIPWMLMMLILLVAAEWFLRKYFGGY
jgi:phage-related tail protein